MKKQLLLIAVVLFTMLGYSVQVNALNPYAYGLKAAFNSDKSSIDVNYSLNTNAKTGQLVFYDDGVVVKTIELVENQLNAGENMIEVSTALLPAGKKLSWKISVTGDAVSDPTEYVDKEYKFYHPQGVDVDNNFDSPYFGRIYVTECMTPTGDEYHSGQSTEDGKGLYVFNPTLAPVKNSNGTYAFKGGLTYEDRLAFSADASQTAYDPRKVRISKDGRVFLTRQAGKASSLYEVNPNDLNAPFTEIFKGTLDESTFELKNDAGERIASTNVGFDVKGSGENLKLLMLNSTASGLQFSYAGFSTDEYNLGTATTWNAVPSKNISELTGQFTIQGNNTNVLYDNEGGIWYTQYRSNPSDEQPAVVHVNAEGEIDYFDNSTVVAGAGARFNSDYSMMALANDRKQIGVYSVGKDNAGAPQLTLLYSFPSSIGTNCNDIAWDVANNLYIVGNSGEWFKVFALPRTTTDVAVTDAPQSYALTIPENEKKELYIIGEVEGTNYNWAPNNGVALPETEVAGVYSASMRLGNEDSAISHFGLVTKLATTDSDWDTINNNRLAGAESGDVALVSGVALPLVAGTGAFTVPSGVYAIVVDMNAMTITATMQGGSAKKAYIIGEVEGTDYMWATNAGVEMPETETPGVFKSTMIVGDGNSPVAHFGLTTKLAETDMDWDYIRPYRLCGDPANNTTLTSGVPQALVNSEKAFSIVPGTYEITVDLNAMTIIATSMNAPEYSLVQLRKFTEGFPASSEGRQAMYNNGKLYIQDKSTNQIEIWTKDGKSENVISGSGAGVELTVDEAGNLITWGGEFPGSITTADATTTDINVFPADGSSMKTIHLTNLPEGMGRSDFFGKVRGNILSEDGGEMYFVVNMGLSIVVVPIQMGVQDVENTSTLALTQGQIADGGTIVYPFDENSVIYNRRNAGNSLIKVGIEPKMTGGYEVTDEGYALVTPDHNAANGSDVFELNGVKYVVYPSGTNYRDGFSIAKVSNDPANAVCATFKETCTANPNGIQCNWVYAQPVSNTRALIYQYVPGGYIAIYEFNTVENTYPETLYVLGNLKDANWDCVTTTNVLNPVQDMVGVYEGSCEVVEDTDDTPGFGWFAFSSSNRDWDSSFDARIGAPVDGTVISIGTETALESAKGAFKVVPGKYKFHADLPFNRLVVLNDSASQVVKPIVNEVLVIAGNGEINVVGECTHIEVYTLGGVMISYNQAHVVCAPGVYLVKVDGKVTKVIVR